jgi:hypothetical protein
MLQHRVKSAGADVSRCTRWQPRELRDGFDGAFVEGLLHAVNLEQRLVLPISAFSGWVRMRR